MNKPAYWVVRSGRFFTVEQSAVRPDGALDDCGPYSSHYRAMSMASELERVITIDLIRSTPEHVWQRLDTRVLCTIADWLDL